MWVECERSWSACLRGEEKAQKTPFSYWNYELIFTSRLVSCGKKFKGSIPWIRLLHTQLADCCHGWWLSPCPRGPGAPSGPHEGLAAAWMYIFSPRGNSNARVTEEETKQGLRAQWNRSTTLLPTSRKMKRLSDLMTLFRIYFHHSMRNKTFLLACI